MTAAPVDRRERILRRLEAVIKAIRGPGSTFPTWDGTASPREIVSDLGGRVYNRVRQDELTRDQLPAVDVLVDSSSPDSIETLGQELARATIPVQVWGYALSREENAQLSTGVRGPLNDLRADLIVALESLPWWTGPGVDEQDPLSRHGAVSVEISRQWTEPDMGQPSGYLVIECNVSYLFTTGNP